MDPNQDFSVTFTLTGYQPLSVPVVMTQPEGLRGAEAEVEKAFMPNPVAIALEPAPKTPPKRTPTPARKPAPKPATTSAAPPAPQPAMTAPPPASPPPATAPGASPWPPIQ
ncbi:MAG: hypothetical protein WEC82_01740 [Xanthobacteraceae bacterium]